MISDLNGAIYKPCQSVESVPGWLVTAIRFSLAFIWLYEGLWKKLISPDATEVAIIGSTAPAFHLSADVLRIIIGSGECALAFGIILGVFHRGLSALQFVLIIAMNLTGILAGGGAIHSPGDLIARNLPLLLCIVVYGFCGPGLFAIKRAR